MLEQDVKGNVTTGTAFGGRSNGNVTALRRTAGSRPRQAVATPGAVGGMMAWRRRDLTVDDWWVPVSVDAEVELELLADALADFDGPVEDLALDAFDWPATADLMAEVRRRLHKGVGFAVLDRLPVERWTGKAIKAVSWMVNSLLATPMMQKRKGRRVYDVRDTGATLQHGVPRPVTNPEQEFHTDGSWLALTPDIISLVCINQAPVGGRSRVASLVTAHDVLLETEPALLQRLYKHYWWDRQAEHGDSAVLATWQPVFERDDRRFMTRYHEDYIRNGHGLVDRSIDDKGDEALLAMRKIIEMPENWIEFRLEPGQIEFVNNTAVAHARTAFEDAPVGLPPRHLHRFWLRSGGEVELDAGSAASG